MTIAEQNQMQSMQALNDPELYQWHFFLRWHSRESKDHKKEHDQSFSRVLNEALNWVGEKSGAQYSTLSNIISLQVSERLASADWRECDHGVLRNLEARTLLDTFYIQVGQAYQGVYQPNVFSQLVRWVPTALNSEPTSHIYIGEAVCLCAEVKEGLPKDEDTLNMLIAEIAEAAGASKPRNKLDSICLTFGILIPLPAAEKETFVLLYPSSQTSRVGHFVHYTMPQLLLSHQKVLRITDEYHRSLLPRAQDQEQSLDSLLEQALKSKISLEQHEKLVIDISRQQASLAKIISILEDGLNTMRVNLYNLELLLRDSVWNDQQQSHQQITGMISLQIKQMETKLCYMNIMKKQADLVLQSLHTLVGVRETCWERRITVVLGLFGVTGVVIVFDDVFKALPLYYRIIALIIGFAIVYWFIHNVKGE